MSKKKFIKPIDFKNDKLTLSAILNAAEEEHNRMRNTKTDNPILIIGADMKEEHINHINIFHNRKEGYIGINIPVSKLHNLNLEIIKRRLVHKIENEIEAVVNNKSDKVIKLYLCRTLQDREISVEDQNFLEVHPEKAYLFTKLYICYEKPVDFSCETARKIELPSYMYPEIQPGQFVELNS